MQYIYIIKINLINFLIFLYIKYEIYIFNIKLNKIKIFPLAKLLIKNL